jgi:hypothetical protein
VGHDACGLRPEVQTFKPSEIHVVGRDNVT